MGSFCSSRNGLEEIRDTVKEWYGCGCSEHVCGRGGFTAATMAWARILRTHTQIFAAVRGVPRGWQGARREGDGHLQKTSLPSRSAPTQTGSTSLQHHERVNLLSSPSAGSEAGNMMKR